MGTGWRSAFCTSIRRDRETDRPQHSPGPSPSPSPRSCAKLSFFSGGGSNSSTPRLQSQGAAPGLSCRTKSTPPGSPRVQQCKAAAAALTSSCTPPQSSTGITRKRSPVLSLFKAASNQSSPRSPSRFAFLKATLHHSRSRCGICSGSVKAGAGTAVFTAECSHAFHFPCIAAHVRSHGSLACPVCSATWRRAPLLSAVHQLQSGAQDGEVGGAVAAESRKKAQSISRRNEKGLGRGSEDRAGDFPAAAAAATKMYDDDEPLPLTKTSPRSGVLFNPIPEADEDNADDEEAEDGEGGLEVGEGFHGFSVDPPPPCKRNEFKVMPEAVALVSSGRRQGSYVVKLKVRAPPLRPAMAPLLDSGHRAPLDLVTVLDVSGGMTATKLHMLKRAMRLVISSLGPADRLSVVAFSSSAAKRLLPLRRMSRQGQRSARQIVERLVVCGGGSTGAGGASVGDALRKATRVLEDRRERNPVATIMLLSDGQQQQQQVEADTMMQKKGDHAVNSTADDRRQRQRQHPSSASTRFAHMEIPIHASGFGEARQQKQGQGHSAPMVDAFAKCVGGLVSVVMQDVHVRFVVPSAGEISAVYSSGGGGGWAVAVGGGGSSSVRLGDLYAEEERELLLELRVPHHACLPQSLSVQYRFRDPATREIVCGGEQPLLLPPLPSQSNSELNSTHLRNLFVTTRAVAESRRLADLTDFATALHLLSSARSLLQQSPVAASDQEDLVRSLEAEIANLQRRRAQVQHQQHHSPSPLQRPREAEGRGEPLTPTSAWRAAEQLAKVAIMRKSLNRVSDLHGFENARF